MNNLHTVLSCRDLSVSYSGKPVLWSIHFDMPNGVLGGIIGANGSGKTTLLKAIMGLLKPQQGSIQVLGSLIEEAKSRVSYVPQRESVDWNFPITVEEVVAMGRYQARQGTWRKNKSEDNQMIDDSLEKVEMTSFRKQQISQLSGGQQQRVFLARALCKTADLYILDEPFAGVDASSEAKIWSVLHQLKNEGKSVLVVHHDLQTARENFDWLMFMNTYLIAAGKTEDVFTDENLRKAYGSNENFLSEISQTLTNKPGL
ncbi:MAG TPA: metal ABC transporter ATP-binding protein [Luteibaculaceae bacterium]|nr:metal ABC transporter ATP-binding protein [Luteibaculaceae bacterium]